MAMEDHDCHEPSFKTPMQNVLHWLNTAKGLIAAVAALVVSIGSFMKPPDTRVTKAAYEELSIALKQVSADNAKNHDDMTALKAWVAGRMEQEYQFMNRIEPAPKPVPIPVPTRQKALAKKLPELPAPAAPPPESPRPVEPAVRNFENLSK